MAGKQQLQLTKNNDFNDPFVAGQMVGMLVMLTFIENNNGIPKELLQEIKQTCANNIETFLDKPIEDIFLMVDNMVKDIEKQ